MKSKFQSFAVQIASVIEDYAYFKGLGFGDQSASLLGAVYTETAIKVAGYLSVFTFIVTVKGSRFDRNWRRWLFTCFTLARLTVYLSLVGAYFFPLHYYALFAFAKAGAEEVLKMAMTAAWMAMLLHWARHNNVGDIASKLFALGNTVSLVAMPVNFGVLYVIEEYRWVDN